MKAKTLLVSVLGFLAFAASASAAPIQIRVDCESQGAYKPYVRVRGTLLVDDSMNYDNVRGNLRVATTTTRDVSLTMLGNYVKQGSIEYAELETLNSNADVDQIFIDLAAGPFLENSYVSSVRGDFRRMACRVNR